MLMTKTSRRLSILVVLLAPTTICIASTLRATSAGSAGGPPALPHHNWPVWQAGRLRSQLRLRGELEQEPKTGPTPTTPSPQSAAPAVDEWGDEFDGDKLDDTKWELYTFEGGGSSKVEVKDKLLKLRGAGATRSGVRSKQAFHTDRFYVEAAVAKVGPQLPQPGGDSYVPGYAILTVLFDGTATNRLEWILRSDGGFEAWSMIDGKSERLDNRKLATREKSPRLGIARRGDQIYFMLNREVGMQQTIRNLSQNFKVMLYGFGSTENHWDSIYVQTPKQ